MKDLFSSVQIKISIKAKVSLKCILEKFSISVAALVESLSVCGRIGVWFIFD